MAFSLLNMGENPDTWDVTRMVIEPIFTFTYVHSPEG